MKIIETKMNKISSSNILEETLFNSIHVNNSMNILLIINYFLQIKEILYTVT